MIYELGPGNTLIEFYWDENLEKHEVHYRHEPYIYVPTAELDRVLGAPEVVRIEHVGEGFKNQGVIEDVSKVFVNHNSQVSQLRGKFSRTYEADLPYIRRCVFDCVKKIRNENKVIFFFDLETEVRSDLLDPENRILSIACYDTKTERRVVFWWAPADTQVDESTLPDYHERYHSESEMLAAFANYFNGIDPSILTAWNLSGFDLKALHNRLGNQYLSPFVEGDGRKIKGRLCMDLAEIYRKVVARTTAWSLAKVAEAEQIENGKIKLDVPPQDLWAQGRFEELIVYNMRDVDVMIDLENKLQMIQFMLDVQALAHLPMDSCWSPAPIIDALCIRTSKKPLPSKVPHAGAKIQGGYVHTPVPGMYENVVIYDFFSEYPNNIMTWNLSPEMIDPEGEIEVGNGLRLRGDKPGLLPEILIELMELRAHYKKTDKRKYNAIKSIINATYGVMGFPDFRVYEPEIASAITYLGRWLTQMCMAWLEDHGYHGIYADTDSTFATGIPLDKAESVAVELNDYLNAEIRKTTSRKSTVKMEYEASFDKILMIGKKRYYGRYMPDEKGHQSVKIRGLEIIRTNAAKISQAAQSEIIDKIFNGGDIEASVADLRARFKQLPLSEISIPQQVHSDSDTPHLRAKKLGESRGCKFDTMDPIHIVYVKGQKFDCVPVHPDMNMEGIQVDYNAMWEKTVVAKIKVLVDPLNISIPVLRPTLEEAFNQEYSAEVDSSNFDDLFANAPEFVEIEEEVIVKKRKRAKRRTLEDFSNGN